MWLIMLIILAVIFISGVLIKRIIPENKLDAWANVSSIVGGIATAISLLWAAYTFYEGAKIQKELAASSIYQEHMKLSIENPDFANGSLAPKPPGIGGSVADKMRYEKYRWYIGHALYSFESIFDVMPGDENWDSTAVQFIKGHSEYIRDSFPCNRYTDRIQQLVKEAIGRDCSR